MSTDPDDWFADIDGRDPVEQVFLARLRQDAAAWDLAGIGPADTTCYGFLEPLYLDVRVPALADISAVLQIGFRSRGATGSLSPSEWTLDGYWGDNFLLDDRDRNKDDRLVVVGVGAPPEDHGRWAAAWFRRQLARSIVRDEWLQGDRVVASTWRFSDSGGVLHRQGSRLRHRRRPPDRTMRVR